MTPEQHNKYLAYSNIAYGGLMSLLAIVMTVFMAAMMGFGPGPGPPLGVIVFMCLFILGIYSAMTVPSFIAAWALLKRKKWARTASIVAGVVAASNFPIGTAVCVYTFWFLFSDPGKVFFDQNYNPYALPAAQPTWANQSWEHDTRRLREGQFQPPPSPPDWR